MFILCTVNQSLIRTTTLSILLHKLCRAGKGIKKCLKLAFSPLYCNQACFWDKKFICLRSPRAQELQRMRRVSWLSSWTRIHFRRVSLSVRCVVLRSSYVFTTHANLKMRLFCFFSGVMTQNVTLSFVFVFFKWSDVVFCLKCELFLLKNN